MENYTEAMRVLDECKEIMRKKSNDYQNPLSTVRQADHYPNGCQTIYDMVHQKLIRMRSIMESGGNTNFESLEDSAKDAINYLSFFVEYSRKKMDGQSDTRDIFNKPLKAEKKPEPIKKTYLESWYEDEIKNSQGWTNLLANSVNKNTTTTFTFKKNPITINTVNGTITMNANHVITSVKLDSMSNG